MSRNSAAKVSSPIADARRCPAATKISVPALRLRDQRRGSASAVVRSPPSSVGLPEARCACRSRQVEHQRHQHQRQPGGEDGLVADAAVRQVAQRHLHDVGGDRRRGLERIEASGWAACRRRRRRSSSRRSPARCRGCRRRRCRRGRPGRTTLHRRLQPGRAHARTSLRAAPSARRASRPREIEAT